MSSTTDTSKLFFGPFEVTTQTFLRTPHSFALVNIKPLLPGHVLICPTRAHKRLTDLTAPELTDLFTTVQRVQHMLARHYFAAPSSALSASPPRPGSKASSSPAAAAAPEAGSFNIALQDGAEAGQTVAHVHVHIIPRIRGSTAKPAETPGDELYERMAAEDSNVGGALWDREQRGLRRDAAVAPADMKEDPASGEIRGRPSPGGHFPRIEDADRHARSMAEMEAEAEMFRRVLREMEKEENDG